MEPTDKQDAAVEAVEREAARLWETEGAGAEYHGPEWGEITERQRDAYRIKALRALRDNAALQPPSEPSSDWRPIETAPKDGAEILVPHAHERVAVAKWGTGHFHNPEHGSRELTGWLSRGFFMGPQPTHWMPMPPSALKDETQ